MMLNGTIFYIGNQPVRFDIDAEEDPWAIIDNIKLSATQEDHFGNTTVVHILPRSDRDITYDLYPIQQGDRLYLDDLNIDLTDSTELTKTINPDTGETILKHGDLAVHIKDDGSGILYILTNRGRFVSGFKDEDYSFQAGDYDVKGYLIGDDQIAINNSGDVSSIVIINGISNLFMRY